jgi:hypothetical protein
MSIVGEIFDINDFSEVAILPSSCDWSPLLRNLPLLVILVATVEMNPGPFEPYASTLTTIPSTVSKH